MKHRRVLTRRRVKWVATAIFVTLIALIFVSELNLSDEFREWRLAGNSGVYLETGFVIILVEDPEFPSRWNAIRDWRRYVALYRSYVGLSGGGYISSGRESAVVWRSRFLPSLSEGSWWIIQVPLVPIAVPLMIATALLWRTDRRAKPWQCANCRYDLRGLDGEENGVCPECGKPMVGKA